ncbi:MAG: dimethylargininase [Chlamydiia bacterium]|nr:dimethylargininase [Chlamydiia bacterium]
MRYIYLTAFLFSAACGFAEPFYNYTHAIVRELSEGFLSSLKQEEPDSPIDIELAKSQHNAYVSTLQKLLQNTIVLEGSEAYPDCNFIEDTAIVAKDKAVICRMGAQSRRGEEILIHETLKNLGLACYPMDEPVKLDGGDVLYTGKHLFVGISKRTNISAFDALSEIFSKDMDVIAIPVSGALHLKSSVSLLDENTLVIADNASGRAIQKWMDAQASYQFVAVPDPVASNVLRIKDTLIIQSGYPASEAILKLEAESRGLKVIALNMSELIKADGALTCGSLLF